jgi:hypothetical protein
MANQADGIRYPVLDWATATSYFPNLSIHTRSQWTNAELTAGHGDHLDAWDEFQLRTTFSG